MRVTLRKLCTAGLERFGVYQFSGLQATRLGPGVRPGAQAVRVPKCTAHHAS